jgi:hypothetical protein
LLTKCCRQSFWKKQHQRPGLFLFGERHRDRDERELAKEGRKEAQDAHQPFCNGLGTRSL